MYFCLTSEVVPLFADMDELILCLLQIVPHALNLIRKIRNERGLQNMAQIKFCVQQNNATNKLINLKLASCSRVSLYCCLLRRHWTAYLKRGDMMRIYQSFMTFSMDVSCELNNLFKTSECLLIIKLKTTLSALYSIWSYARRIRRREKLLWLVKEHGML